MFELDFSHLAEFGYLTSSRLADLVFETSYVIDQYQNIVREMSGNDNAVIRLTNYPLFKNVSDLRIENYDEIYTVEATVLRSSGPMGIIKTGHFICQYNHHNYIDFVNGVFHQPDSCKIEDCKKPLTFLEEGSEHQNYQLLTVQENSDNLTPGTNPSKINVILKDDLVNITRPGDLVEIIGIVRKKQRKRKQKGKVLEYEKELEANNLIVKSKRLDTIELSKAEIEQLHTLAKTQNYFKNIVSSIAPYVYGMDGIKEASILTAVRGTYKDYNETKIRSWSHLLIAGDPSTGKSQLITELSEILPRCIFTDGKGNSAAGLTAAMVKVDNSDEMVLEAGALSLADGGTCIIDEFDKMNSKDRKSIYGVMQKGEINVAKAGTIATLSARTSIIAGANPVNFHWDESLSFEKNINLDAALLSRFDLIFIVRDIPGSDEDLVINKHIMDSQIDPDHFEKIYPLELLRKIIIHAQTYRPYLSKAAQKIIYNYFIKLRMLSKEDVLGMRVARRHLTGMIRLAEARAKIHFRNVVTEADANSTIELFNKALNTTTPNDITVAIEEVKIRKTNGQATLANSLPHGALNGEYENIRKNIIKLLVKAKDKAIPEKRLLTKFKDFPSDHIKGSLGLMLEEGTLIKNQDGNYRLPR